jgi:hypothetical protein
MIGKGLLLLGFLLVCTAIVSYLFETCPEWDEEDGDGC